MVLRINIEVDSAELGKEISATLTKFMNQLQSKDEKYSNKEEIQKKMFLQFQEYIKDEKSCNIICNALANPPKNSFGDFVLNKVIGIKSKQLTIKLLNYLKSLNIKLCEICFSNKGDYAIIPCGHQIYCNKCLEKLQNCPICRKTIISKLKLF